MLRQWDAGLFSRLPLRLLRTGACGWYVYQKDDSKTAPVTKVNMEARGRSSVPIGGAVCVCCELQWERNIELLLRLYLRCPAKMQTCITIKASHQFKNVPLVKILAPQKKSSARMLGTNFRDMALI